MRTTTDRRHRRRPGRAGHEPVPHRALDRPCRARAGRGRQLVAPERWDSLRLLTPNWQSRLPGYRYDGRRSRRLHDHARGHRLPRRLRATRSTRPCETSTDGHVGAPRPTTATWSTPTTGEWRARTVVIASGAFNPPRHARPCGRVPSASDRHAGRLSQPRTSSTTVASWSSGASATGIQLADEIHRSGRAGHPRGGRPRPRAPGLPGHGHHVVAGRGRASSTSATTRSTTSCGPAACRPSSSSARPTGRPSTSTPSRTIGVKLVGRLAGVTSAGIAQFSGSLRNQCSARRPQAPPAARHHRHLGRRPRPPP